MTASATARLANGAPPEKRFGPALAASRGLACVGAAACGIVEQKGRRLRDQCAGDQRFLLVAAAEVENIRFEPLSVEAQTLRGRRDATPLLFERKPTKHW
jgi:hypothetical protein